jgi:hypothetical protein
MGVLNLWWRSVRDERAWSGVRLWVDAWRDLKASKLRAVRRVRDERSAKRRAEHDLWVKQGWLAPDRSALAQLNGAAMHAQQAVMNVPYRAYGNPLQQSSLSQSYLNGLGNSALNSLFR